MKHFCLILAILLVILNLIYFANAENEADWMPDANLRQDSSFETRLSRGCTIDPTDIA